MSLCRISKCAIIVPFSTVACLRSMLSEVSGQCLPIPVVAEKKRGKEHVLRGRNRIFVMPGKLVRFCLC